MKTAMTPNIKVLPDDDGIRPAGKPDECFFCRQKIGQQHKPECVCLVRRVKVRYIFEIEIDVPHFWDKHQIEFHRNDSSWCASNAVNDIQAFIGDDCLCPYFRAQVLHRPDVPAVRSKES